MIFSKRQKIQSFDDEELDIDEAYKLKKKEDPSKMRCSIKLLIMMIALFIVGVFIKLNDYKGDQILDNYSFTTCPEGKYSNRNQCQFCNYKCLKCTDVYGLCINCEKDYQPDHNGVCKKNLEKQIIIKENNNIPYQVNVGSLQDHFFVILQDNIYDTFKYNLNYTFITIDTYNLIQQKGQIIDEKFINKTLDTVDKIKKQNFTSKLLISYGCKQYQAFRILQKSKIFDQLFIINPIDQDCEQFIHDDLLNSNFKPFQKQKISVKNFNFSVSYLLSNLDDCKNSQKRLLMQQFRIIGEDANQVKGNSSETENKELNQTNSDNSANQTSSTNSVNSTNPNNTTEVKQNEKSNDTIIDKNQTQEKTNGNHSQQNTTDSNQTSANITKDQNKTINNQNETDSKNREQQSNNSTSDDKKNITNAEDNKNGTTGSQNKGQDNKEQKQEEESEESEESKESEETEESEDLEQISVLKSDDKGSSEETLEDSVEDKKIESKCYKLNDNYQSQKSLLDQISQIIKNQTQI